LDLILPATPEHRGILWNEIYRNEPQRITGNSSNRLRRSGDTLVRVVECEFVEETQVLLRSTRLLVAGRALANMTQTDLADAAGIAVSVLQAIEQGKSDPKLSTVLALLDALKAQGVELLTGSDSVAWGVYVVPGSPAAAGGTPQPIEMAQPPQRKRRGRPPGKSKAGKR
jgi:DNA-binding XRE family transcriptional regulator